MKVGDIYIFQSFGNLMQIAELQYENGFGYYFQASFGKLKANTTICINIDKIIGLEVSKDGLFGKIEYFYIYHKQIGVYWKGIHKEYNHYFWNNINQLTWKNLKLSPITT